MKKTIATLTFLLIAGAIFGQEGAKVGFRASPLVSWATVTNDSTKTKPEGLTTKAKLGFSFDFIFTYGFTENIALATGLNISTRGYGTEQNVDLSAFGGSANETFESKANFTAVEIPIGLKFRSPEIGDGIFIVGNFGVAAELNVQNKLLTDELTVDLSNPTAPTFAVNRGVEYRDVDGLNLITGSFTPGAGIDWEFDWGMLQFMATYHWGLLSITDADATRFDNINTKINYLALNIGYYF